MLIFIWKFISYHLRSGALQLKKQALPSFNESIGSAINVYPTNEQAIKEMIVIMYIAYVCITDHV
jgi:hypothetical protein